MPIEVVAKIESLPESTAIVRNALIAMLEPTRRESGCIAYNLHESTDEKGVFVMIESWESQAHLDNHFQTEHMKKLLTALEGKTSSVTVDTLTKIEK